MAINIYSGSAGGKSSSKKNKKKTQTNTRPQKSAQSVNAELKGSAVSTEGTTAVKKTGILSKIGSLAKKALPLAAKYLPGVAGTIAKVGESIFNDPEWWQHVPGESVSMNAPLSKVAVDTDQTSTITQTGTSPYYVSTTGVPLVHFRPVFQEFTHRPFEYDSLQQTWVYDPRNFLNPSDAAVTQYLMSSIRKAVNAVPLQTASNYTLVLANNALAYALWQTLKKFDYMLKHGQTYLPSFNDSMFPILQVENAAYLESAISRIEEYLHASVRLPHTLCEYLAWRYGRVYKINQNKKSALILYNVINASSSLSDWKNLIDTVLTYTSTASPLQFAATDIFNTYFDHDLSVVIRDDTQFVYDLKEYALRTNLDVLVDGDTGTEITGECFGDLNPIKIDSDLDNPTVFMASTVSTVVKIDASNNMPVKPLIPVAFSYVYIQGSYPYNLMGDWPTGQPGGYLTRTLGAATPQAGGSSYTAFSMSGFITYPTGLSAGRSMALADFFRNVMKLSLAKMMDYYNAGYYFAFGLDGNVGTQSTETSAHRVWADCTAISDDLGVVSDEVVYNEQVFAFANLVNADDKHSQTMKQAESIVATETANTIANAGVSVVR